VASERVGAAQGQDSKRDVGPMHHALQDLVHGTVSATGKDDVSAASAGVRGLTGGGARSIGCDCLDFDAVLAQSLRHTFDHLNALRRSSSCHGVVEENGAAHAG
jgi:hypothetical protein